VADELSDAEESLPRRRRGPLPPRAILGIVLLVIAATGALYWVAPRVLPVRVLEGPLVQQPSETGATLVWYTTKPSACQLRVTVAGAAREVTVEMTGRRHRAVLSGLAAGERYPYRISAGPRELAGGTLHTNRPAGSSFSFIVFGDSGRASQEQFLLARQMIAKSPDLLLHTGDLVYPDGERRRYRERFFEPYAPLLRDVCFWPSLGNHDVSKPHFGAPYREVFELPENGPAEVTPEDNYWFDYAGARFVVIDSTADEATLRKRITPWAADVLGTAGENWKFVVFHHPPYTGGRYEPNQLIQQTLVPVFDQAGVDVVFNGHDHNYQRTHPLRGGAIVPPGEGVVYVVTGAGGARLYEPRSAGRPAYLAASDFQVHSFTHVRVEGDSLTLQQIALGGRVLDTWEVMRRGTTQEHVQKGS